MISEQLVKMLPDNKKAFTLDNKYGDVNDYVRAKERCSGYNQAIDNMRKVFEKVEIDAEDLGFMIYCILRHERYSEIKGKCKEILGCPKLKLTDFWEQVTPEQWSQLLEIPEAKDFKEGFEYISGQKINDTFVKIECEGKTVHISRESAKALGLVKNEV